MIRFAWIALQIFAQMFVGTIFWQRVGKGRILSRPLWRFPFFRPYVRHYGYGIVFVFYTWTRIAQVLVITAPYLSCGLAGLLPAWCNYAYSGIIIVLYLDDYVTGDDDKWKRFKEWARNTVKWKMTLPRPAPEKG